MPEHPNPKLRSPLPPASRGRDALAYAELDVATNFSFLRGASHPDELVNRAAELGYRALGVTDLNSLAGVVRAHEAARAVDVPLVIGARLALADAPDLLVWPTDRAAYGRLCRLLTVGKRRAGKGQCDLGLADVLEHQAGMLAAIDPFARSVAAPTSPAATPLAKLAGGTVSYHALPRLRDAFGDRLSIAASLAYGPDDQGRLGELRALGRTFGVPLLATNRAHYHDPSRRPLQDVLTCVRHRCTIQQAGFKLSPNAERCLKSPEQMHRLFRDAPEAIRRGIEVAEQCRFHFDELRYSYPDELSPAGTTPLAYLRELAWRGAAERYPGGVPDRVRRQVEHELALIDQLKFEAYFLTVHDLVRFARSRGILCQGRGSAANSAVCYCLGVTSVDPARIDVLFERFISAARNEPPDIDIDFEHERREEVLQYVYAKYGRDRCAMTAEVISYRGRSAVRDVGKALGLSLDLVDQMAKRLDWWHRGTLTGAQLAEVGLDPADPTVRMVVGLSGELLGFPRHLSQHVGGMVMTRGPLCEMVPIENAAMDGRTVIEWDKDDIDVVGILKVDCLGLGMLTCISKAFRLVEGRREKDTAGWNDEIRMTNDESMTNVQMTNDQTSGAPDPSRLNIAPSDIEDSFVIRHSDFVIDSSFGFRHSDFPTPRLQLHTVPPEDPAVYDMIGDADTVGVFQIESRAQMTMLPRLRPRCFYDLVIEVAIVRPGPIQGNMVHPYLRRRQGEEAVTYPSEALRAVLEKTLGVPLFQEQAMRVAMVGAGFSAGEADQLRRAMAAWRKNGALETFHERIISGMLANGYEPAFAEQCWEQIRGFGEYGFPESHSASFALLVYVSAWLKRHHPAAFAAALINSQPMGFYAPAQIVRDAREHGVEVREGDVNESGWDCGLEGDRKDEIRMTNDESMSECPMANAQTSGAPDPSRLNIGPSDIGDSFVIRHSDFVIPRSVGPALRLGLRLIKGLRQADADRIVAARARSGPFTSVAQFRRATGLTRQVIRRLAEADAFGSLGLTRRQALWEVLALSDEQLPLFEEDAPGAPAPAAVSLPVMPVGQEVMADYRTAGLSLKAHPLASLRATLAASRVITAAAMRQLTHGRWAKVAGLVLMRQRPGTASGIVFETLEDETGIVNLIIRPDLYDRSRPAARHAALLQAEGNVERQGQVVHLMARRLTDLSHLLPGYCLASRDFH